MGGVWIGVLGASALGIQVTLGVGGGARLTFNSFFFAPFGALFCLRFAPPPYQPPTWPCLCLACTTHRKGAAEAQHRLGLVYARGKGGVRGDLARRIPAIGAAVSRFSTRKRGTRAP